MATGSASVVPGFTPTDPSAALASRALEFSQQCEAYNRQIGQAFDRFCVTGIWELPPDPFSVPQRPLT